MAAVIDAPTSDDIERLASFFYADMQNLGVETTMERQREVARGVVDAESYECLCWVVRPSQGEQAQGVVLANRNWSVKFGGKSLWIESLYVDPAARRSGYGRMMVEYVLDWAEEHGIHGVDLEAYRGNTPASILYRSLGFYRLGRERFYYRLDEGSGFL